MTTLVDRVAVRLARYAARLLLRGPARRVQRLDTAHRAPDGSRRPLLDWDAWYAARGHHVVRVTQLMHRNASERVRSGQTTK